MRRPLMPAERIVERAREEVRRGVLYDASYRSIAYPNGDVDSKRGACTDVVIRSLRAAGYDLQRLVHLDMTSHFGRYPQTFGAAGPDPNIDHRRVPNLIVFLTRFGRRLPLAVDGEARSTWQPGDIVFWKLDGGHDHCGVISNALGGDALPLVIHNLAQAAEEDCLRRWRITGHFRYPRQDMHGIKSDRQEG